MSLNRPAAILPLLMFIMLAGGCAAPQQAPMAQNWRLALDRELPRMGHRNWIVVADSAYPLQSRQGILTLYSGEDHLAVLSEVLERIKGSDHVAPIVSLDAELAKVNETDAPGIGEYRQKLDQALAGMPRQVKPHMEIIKSLDEAAALFRVIVIKTNLTLPYTSVFIELDCAYWDGHKEQRMRAATQPG